MREQTPTPIRVANRTDLEAMYQLDVRCFAEPFRFSRRAMRTFALEENAGVFVAGSGEELAGFVIVHLEQGEGRMFGYVVTLDVQPEMRRQGLARRLMQAAERHAADAGAQRIMLHVHAGNAEAVAFYERAGYRKTGTAAGFYGPGMDGWLYEKVPG